MAHPDWDIAYKNALGKTSKCDPKGRKHYYEVIAYHPLQRSFLEWAKPVTHSGPWEMTHSHGCDLNKWRNCGSSEVLKCSNNPVASFVTAWLKVSAPCVTCALTVPCSFSEHTTFAKYLLCASPWARLWRHKWKDRVPSLEDLRGKWGGPWTKAIAICSDQWQNEGIFYIRLNHPEKSRKLHRGSI